MTYNPLFDDIMTGDVLRWFFTRITIDNANNMINMSNTNKYGISGARDSKLTVNNVNSSDEGYYYFEMKTFYLIDIQEPAWMYTL